MLESKACHQGLKVRSRFFGLEALDLLLLFPGVYVCIVILETPLLGAIVTIASAAVIRVLKWGRLPGYTQALAAYVLLPSHNAALGYDHAPPYPVVGQKKSVG